MLDLGISLFSDPHALHRFDKETQAELRAYWQILRATDQRGSRGGKLKPSDLRLMSGVPASAGDLAHVWLLSHPSTASAGTTQHGGLRKQWKKQGHSDRALDFWLQ